MSAQKIPEPDLSDTGITQLYGRYVSGELGFDFDEAAVALAVRAFVDTVGVSYAAVGEPVLARLEEALGDRLGSGAASTVTGLRAPAGEAALINGTAAHVLDFDDTADAIKGHPSAVLVPAIIAVGDEVGASGTEMLRSYCVGFQVAMSAGAGLDIKPHYERGWHSTATAGLLGVVGALAHLTRLDARTAQHAFGIAASMAAGNLQNFGTATKSLHSGLTASNGIRAVEFARAGITADPDQLEGKYGFFALYSPSPAIEAGREMLLGPCAMHSENVGINVKRYPCCSTPHPAVDVAVELSEELSVDEIERIDVTVQPHGLDPLMYHRPTDGLQAKFSMEYSVAAALCDGRLDFASYEGEAVDRPKVRSLIERIHVAEAPIPPVGPEHWEWIFTTVEIGLAGGEKVRVRRDLPRGHNSLPLTDEQLREKIASCLDLVNADDKVRGAVRRLWELEGYQREAGPLLPVRGE